MEAWAIVLKLVELTDDDELLGGVGADPLEYLIEHHGPLLVDAIEAEAQLKPKLRERWLPSGYLRANLRWQSASLRWGVSL